MKPRTLDSYSLLCLLFFLKYSGKSLRLDALLSIAPISMNGMTENIADFVFRRAGVRSKLINFNDIEEILKKAPVFIIRKSGYSFLILGSTGNSLKIFFPGYRESVSVVPNEPGIYEEIVSARALYLLPFGPARHIFLKQPKMWLISWRPEYSGAYDQLLVRKIDEFIQSKKVAISKPLPLTDISCAALLSSHKTMCFDLPEFYGTFRKINLRRECLFVDSNFVSSALEKLLGKLNSTRPQNLQSMLEFSVKGFTDFLTIHPFHNGNRRIGMLLVSKYLNQFGYEINWDNCSRTELYYWTRCASRGHFRSMIQGFKENLIIRASKLPNNNFLKKDEMFFTS